MEHNIVKFKGKEYRAEHEVNKRSCEGCDIHDNDLCGDVPCTERSRDDCHSVIYKIIIKGETK